MCSGCRGFYDAKTIYKHKRFCEKNLSEQSNIVRISELSDSAEAAGADLEFRRNILDRFRKDDVGEICRTDFVTILFGKKQWARSSKKERTVTMADMRIIGNLIFGFRSESGDQKKSGIDVLDYKQFDILEKVIKKRSIKEVGEKVGLKVRIGFVLKRAVKVMRGYFVMKEDSIKEVDMTRFLDVLNLNWDFIFFTAQIECELRRDGLRKPLAMPDEDDISLLKNFITEELNKLTEKFELWDRHHFVKVRNLVVARLTMFNARRGGEPARLTLNEWKEAMEGSWIDPNMVEKIDDPIEKYLIKNLKLAYQSGKGSRKMVPVLITEDAVRPITRLLSERMNCNVPEKNPYIFPNTGNSNDHVSGYYCLKSVVDMCSGLKRPQLLIADKFRHRVSTIFANLEVPEEQRQLFYSHMGHSEQMNKNVYQCPLAIREVTQVGKFLLNNIDNNSCVHTSRSIGVNSSLVISNANEAERNEPETEMNDNETEVTIGDEVAQINKVSTVENHVQDNVGCPDKCAQSGHTPVNSKAKSRPYTKWVEEESKLIKRYFKEYITDTTNKGRLPGKKEVLKFLEINPILQGRKNKVYLIKTKVFNEKTTYRNKKKLLKYN